MKIVAVADTHSRTHVIDLPKADVLVIAGDACMSGGIDEVREFNDFLGSKKVRDRYGRIIFVAGNHDFLFEKRPVTARNLLTNAQYLFDESTTIENVKFYGTPWQPIFGNWAFNRGEDKLDELYSLIPENTDVLITHCPPHGTLDTTLLDKHVGSYALEERVEKVKPKVHIFGHIHCAYGVEEKEGTKYVNAAYVGEDYIPTNEPVIIDL